MREGTFTATEFHEPIPEPGVPYRGPIETSIGTFEDERQAIEAARRRWRAFRQDSSNEVAWWIVKRRGEGLARWIAESRSDVERVLDLTTHELVELDT